MRALALSCLLAACLFALGGCVFSETITERIIDNNPESQIDYDLDPILKNVATAEETSELLPRLDVEEESQVKDDTQEETPDLADDEDEEPTTDKAATTPEYNPSAADRGNAQNAPTTNSSSNTTSNVGNTEGSDGSDGWATIGGDTDVGGDEGDGDDEEDDDGATTGADDEGDDDGPSQGGEGAGRKPGGTGDYYSDPPNREDPEIPENIDEVVAFGNDAVIVCMMSKNAGKQVLLGCDAATKGKTSGVLSACGMASAEGLDYAEGGAMKAAAFKKLVKLAPDQVYVTEGRDPFSEDQKAQLAQAGINIYTLPLLDSDDDIKFAIEIVGGTLAKGGVAGAQDQCELYESTRRNIIDTYMGNNGGITGGFDFEVGTSEGVAAANDLVATVYIDYWDDNARFIDSDGKLDSSRGVGLATLGFGTSPLNYYLSVGGVLNNAASERMRNHLTSSGKVGIVWQFSREKMSFAFNRWSPAPKANFDLGNSISTGGLFGPCLLAVENLGWRGLGSATFPAVVAKSQLIAQRVRDCSRNPGDLYYPYKTIQAGSVGNTVGYLLGDGAGSNFIESCIGLDGGHSSILNSGDATMENAFPVYANPKGLCQANSEDALCSWDDGSPESVLEASWAYYRFRSGDQVAFQNDVRAFYSNFYGYALSSSELSAIEQGCVK